jgi:hypothetical protein
MSTVVLLRGSNHQTEFKNNTIDKLDKKSERWKEKSDTNNKHNVKVYKEHIFNTNE